MRRVLLSTLLICAAAIGQIYAPSIIYVTADPSGACTVQGYNTQNTLTGNQMSCVGGTWTSVNGGGSGSIVMGGANLTTVNSVPYVSGPATLNQITNNTDDSIKYLTQTAGGTPSWQPISAAGNLTYYFTNTASDIATYLQATPGTYSPKTTLPFTSLPTGTDLLKNWSTNAGIPNLTFIPAGVYVVHLHALRSGGGTVTLYAQIWEVTSAGVDIAMIGQTGNTPALTTSEIEYEVDFSDSNTYTLQSTSSRIVARVYAVVSGSTPTVNLFVGGTADSHMSLPSNAVDVTSFVPYTGATKNIDLGSYNLTTTGALTVTGSSGHLSTGGGYLSMNRPVDTSGVTQYYTVQTTSTGKVQVSGTGLQGVLGIAQSTVSSGGNVDVAYAGITQCYFDTATTINHVFTKSTVNAGQCSDTGQTSGSSVASNVPVIGKILSAVTAGNYATVSLIAPGNYGDLTTFDLLGSGTNTTATMTIGAGGTLTYTSTGVVNASTLTGLAPATANTVSTIVSRDSSGNFSAGTITASLTGLASLNLPLTGGTLTGNLKFTDATYDIGAASSGGRPRNIYLSSLATAAAIPYVNGTNGPLATDTLYWDATNHRLGIGTASPQNALNVFTGGLLQIGMSGDTTYATMSSNGYAFHRNAASYIDQDTVGGTISFRVSVSGTTDTTAFTILSDGNVQFPVQKSTTGQRYVCITTTGQLVSSASACVGT